MTVTAVVGMQNGDEAKGRMVDYLVSKYEEDCMVIRYQGGNNAGHTIFNEYGKLALHQVPSGICNPYATCVMGAGTVVNPDSLLLELHELQNKNIPLNKFYVSARAHIVFPFHIMLDGAEEDCRLGKTNIGTTRKGIGPCYSDKAARVGIRIGDLYSSALKEKLSILVKRNNILLSQYGKEPVSFDQMNRKCEEWKDSLYRYVVDDYPLVQSFLQSNKPILLEGQLGILKDLDWGTYPIVTSSNAITGISSGTGIPANKINEIIGVTKVYTTVVGGGAFPTELHGKAAEELRERGNEYGATTGRPRRVGWLDLVALRYAVEVGGITKMAITKTDIIPEDAKIATQYVVSDFLTKQAQVVDRIPYLSALEENLIDVIYKEFTGLDIDIANGSMNESMKDYIRFVSDNLNIPVGYISFGAEREDMVEL